MQEYDYLRSVTALRRTYGRRSSRAPMQPSLWPVAGQLLSPYGNRTDPFSGEGAYHTGVDIKAPTGTPATAAADGVVVHAERFGGYGLLVVVDHGNGATRITRTCRASTCARVRRSGAANRSVRWEVPGAPRRRTCIMKCALAAPP